jgi:hypothetical protein
MLGDTQLSAGQGHGACAYFVEGYATGLSIFITCGKQRIESLWFRAGPTGCEFEQIVGRVSRRRLPLRQTRFGCAGAIPATFLIRASDLTEFHRILNYHKDNAKFRNAKFEIRKSEMTPISHLELRISPSCANISARR